MRFVWYTEKPVRQCLKDINDRMQVKATATRPALDGWVDTSGSFAISITSRVVSNLSRRTRLRARAEREDGMTIVRGYVPSGVSRGGQAVIFGAILLVGGVLLSRGNALLALVAVLVAVALHIPLTGDYRNSVVLLGELQKTLKAKDTQPKKAARPRRGTARKSSS